VGLQECTRECRRTAEEGANRSKNGPQFVLRSDLVGATLENAAHGAIAPISGIERPLAGALESFNSVAIYQA
jgi:hypothetical protein